MTEHTPLSIDDIADLLAQCAARDQRTIGRADTLAWWQDLNRASVTKPDAEAAISNYYAVEWPKTPANQRFRITAPLVIEMVGKARAQRLEGFVFASRGHRDATGDEYVEALRGQLAATGDGRRPAAPVGEIAPDPDAARQVQALVSGVAAARSLPPEIADVIAKRRPPAMQVPCPHEICRAQPGNPCTDIDGNPRKGGPHLSRIDVWAVLTAACPTCRAAVNDPCRVVGTAIPTSAQHGAHPARLTAAQESA